MTSIMVFKNFQGNVMDKAYSKNLAVSQNPIVSDYFLEPGDYLKLSSVSLGYTLDMKKKYLSSVRIYATDNPTSLRLRSSLV